MACYHAPRRRAHGRPAQGRPAWGFTEHRGGAVLIADGMAGLDGFSLKRGLKRLGKAVKRAGKDTGRFVKKNGKYIAAAAAATAAVYTMGASAGATGGFLAKLKAGGALLKAKAITGLKAVSAGVGKVLGGGGRPGAAPAAADPGGFDPSGALTQMALSKLTGGAPGAGVEDGAGGSGGGGGLPPGAPAQMPEWLLPVGIGAGALVLVLMLSRK